MEENSQPKNSPTDGRNGNSLQGAAYANSDQPLLFPILKMLEAYVGSGSIKLVDGLNNLIRKPGEEPRIVLHCGDFEKPCAHVITVETVNGELGFCKNFMQPPSELVQLRGLGKDARAASDNGHAVAPMMVEESSNMRQQVIDYIGNTIRAVGDDEKAKLVSALGEEEFNAFLERSQDVGKIQSIQYRFTRRINSLKAEGQRKMPKRPVIEQRKVGDYLYKLQPGPKGGNYWYLQYTKDGLRHHEYLGKEKPTFEPETDLLNKNQKKLTRPIKSGKASRPHEKSAL
jgi:hypothetical protein